VIAVLGLAMPVAAVAAVAGARGWCRRRAAAVAGRAGAPPPPARRSLSSAVRVERARP
jgi:hypothetical protein